MDIGREDLTENKTVTGGRQRRYDGAHLDGRDDYSLCPSRKFLYRYFALNTRPKNKEPLPQQKHKMVVRKFTPSYITTYRLFLKDTLTKRERSLKSKSAPLEGNARTET